MDRTVLWEWQTMVVVPLFEKADWRMCLCGRCFGRMELEAICEGLIRSLVHIAGSKSDLILVHV